MDFNIYEGHGKDNIVSAEEIVNITKANEWGKNRVYDMKKVNEALHNSFFIIAIRSRDGDLLGYVRVLSDNLFFTTIPDIHIYPDYKGNGFGTILMERIKEKFGHTKIYFGARNEKVQKFYEKLGFKKAKEIAYTI